MTGIPAVDPTRRPSMLKRAAIPVVLSRPGTWLYMNVASRVDPWLIRITRGHVDSALGTVPIVLLTVRGARTGIDRTVPLLYFTDGDDVILIASSFGRARYPAWYRNIKANPEVSLYRRGHVARYTAHEVEGVEHDRLYGLAAQLYSGYRIYEQRVAGIRDVPVLRLAPVDVT